MGARKGFTPGHSPSLGPLGTHVCIIENVNRKHMGSLGEITSFMFWDLNISMGKYYKDSFIAYFPITKHIQFSQLCVLLQLQTKQHSA